MSLVFFALGYLLTGLGHRLRLRDMVSLILGTDIETMGDAKD